MLFGWIFKQYHKKVMPNLFPSSLAQFCRGYGPLIHELVCKTICNVPNTVQMCKKQANPMQEIICKVAPLFFKADTRHQLANFPSLQSETLYPAPSCSWLFGNKFCTICLSFCIFGGRQILFMYVTKDNPTDVNPIQNLPNFQSSIYVTVRIDHIKQKFLRISKPDYMY